MIIKHLFSKTSGKISFIRNVFSKLINVLIILVFLITAIGLKPALADNPISGDLALKDLGDVSAQTMRLSIPSQLLATWIYTEWIYRNPITITNNSVNTLTDYQVLITLDGSFDFSRARSDGADVRFTSNDDVDLPFWIESWDPAGNLARIWVRIPSIPNGNTIIYLYYGNPAASSASNGSDTFEFFDDDWTNLTSRWQFNHGTTLVLNNGIASFASVDNSGNTGTMLQTLSSYTPSHVLGFRGWFKTGGGFFKWGGFLSGDVAPYLDIGTIAGGPPYIIVTNSINGPRASSDLGDQTSAFHVYELAWTNSVVRAFLDHATSPAGSNTQYIPTGSLPFQIGNYNDSRATFDVDWVYLRNYQEPGPSISIGPAEGSQSADLELTITDSPDPVMRNGELTYAATIINHGPANASSVVFTDNLPAGVNFVSGTGSHGEICSYITNITCNLVDIDSGGIATVTIIATPTSAGTIVNTASVSSSTYDINSANNSASTSTIVVDPTTADLVITQSDSPDPVKPGNSLTYDLIITNQGPADATLVTINDTLPSNVTFISATPDHGTCSHPDAVVCDLGMISNGTSAHVTIVVTTSAEGTITNQAIVSGNEQDPYPLNNTSIETTRVGDISLGAIVLVNSNSLAFADFQHFIQPYLDNFGVPYTVLDIATTPVQTNIADFALIIIGHRQIDIGSTCASGPCLDTTEQTNIAAAVNGGAGLINFDNDLSADGLTARYLFVQDIFNFSYHTPPTGSGVLFTSAAGSHWITARHLAGESISTSGMTLAGITLPGDATLLATTGGAPFLAVRNSGQGYAVQWGTYNWMSASVKGPVYGLDDLVWRSLAWAARKPFIMQGMPPFLTMRVDDVSGPFNWIHVANEVGIKPWAAFFINDIDETEAADLSTLVANHQATTTIHAFGHDNAFFYWGQSDEQMAANYVLGTQWFLDHNIPISKYLLPHWYQFGSNSFAGLVPWGVECVGTQMDPDVGYYDSPWIMNGPYRLYETGLSSGAAPQYYADYMTIPGHPEFNNRFFNLVTEIRDDQGYDWVPSNDVANSVFHGTVEAKRGLDSMALPTLFTHYQYISGISMENWRAIVQGITTNLAPYHPINVTMDYACQYIKSKHDSKIVSSSYDTTTRQVTVNYSGTTEITTKYYLFMNDHGAIRDMWVDVPQFTGSTQVLFTLPGELDHISITPAAPSVISGATQQFVAQGYDISNNPIPNLSFTWSMLNGGGTINNTGLFTAGATQGTYTVVTSVGSITGNTSVTVVAPTLDHFTFQTIATPQYVGAPFQITITARDLSGNLFTGYTGQATLSASLGIITPNVTSNFTGGTWTGNVTLNQVAESISLTANAGDRSGTSNGFAVQAVPILDHFTIGTISSPQVVNAPFQITVTARDASDNPLPVYTGHPTLTSNVGTITPNTTGDFTGGNWVGIVNLSQVADNVAITVTDGGGISATSNEFSVQPPPPYYQLSSSSYIQTAGVPFTVNVDAFHTTINAWEDNHQEPVLITTQSEATLISNASNHIWTEFLANLYLPARTFPSIMASTLHTTNLPTMRFYTGGIPNGRYQVIANLYDVNQIRYFYGFSSANPSEFSVNSLGTHTTGTQHGEYSLGTIDVTTNSFNLYVNNAQLINGGYEYFGWAWVRLVPAEPAPPADITINLWEDNHQYPVLTTTESEATLLSNSASSIWTEFLYTASRPFPSIMGSTLHIPMLPTMHFFSTDIPDGQYQVYANLYDQSPRRYYYGYTDVDPQAQYVDTIGGLAFPTTQHREYLLGTLNITNNRFDLYVNRAADLPGANYEIFGWAWIRLSPLVEIPNNLTLSSSSPTMLFDANGNGIFGEADDNVKLLVNGSLSIQALDITPGVGVTIVGTDYLGQAGSNTYTIAQNDHTISGTTGVAGVTLSYTDGTPKTATSTVGGAYSFTVSYNWSGTVTPSLAGYTFAPVSTTYTNVVTDQTLQNYTATPVTFTLTYTAGAGGSLTGDSPQTVDYGGSGTEVTAVAALGYHFVDWSDGVLTAARTDTNITANLSVTANFALNTFTLTYTAGAGGSLTGDSPQTVSYGGSGTEVTAVPALGYHFVNWSDTSTANPRTDTNVTANLSVTANFALDTFLLTYTAGANGSLTGDSPQTVNYGGSGTPVTAVPALGYHFVNWSDASTANPRTDTNVTANLAVTANFESGWYVAPTGSDTNLGTATSPFLTIQHAIDVASDGDTIKIYPGTYDQDEANSRDRLNGGVGSDNFNIFVDKSVTLQGVDANGVPITNYLNVLATVHAKRDLPTSGEDAIFIQADDVTISGLAILGWNGENNKTVEVAGDNVTIKNCSINAMDGVSAIYMYDPHYASQTDTSHIQSYLIEGNLLDGGGAGLWGAGIRFSSGAGWSGVVSGRLITNNRFQNVMDGIEFVGPMADPWDMYPVGAATITGNNFTDADRRHVIAWGTYEGQLGYGVLNWQAILANNTFDKAVTVWTPAGEIRTYDCVGCGSVGNITNIAGIYTAIQRYPLDRVAQAGDTIHVAAGTYPERLVINKPLTLSGAGAGSSIIDATSFTTPGNVIDITGLTGNTKIEDFHILTGDNNNGIHSSGGTDPTGRIEILNNHIIGTYVVSDYQYGVIAGYGDVRKLVISGNEISNTYSNSILVELQMGETEITTNTLNGGFPSIWFMNYDGMNVITLQKVSGNTIEMSDAEAGSNVAGIGVNPATSFVDPARRSGRYANFEISGNTFTGLGDESVKAINVGENSLDGTSGGITNLMIFNNTISGTNGRGIQLFGHIRDADIHNNTITGLYQGIRGWTGDNSTFFPENNHTYHNQITGASDKLVQWEGTVTFNVETNWWGSSAGPNPAMMSANVDYSPWCADAACTSFAPVVLGSPTGGQLTWNNTFSWTGIPAATYYYVQVIGPNETVVYGEWYSIAQVCSGFDCHISPDSTRDLGAGDYSWRILDYGDYGLGLWTDNLPFTLPQPQIVVLLSPTGSPETWNNTFSWTGIPAATYYYVQVIGPNQTVVYGEWYSIAQACTGLDCHISPDSTRDLGAGDYSWRILDYGDYGLGLWTDNLPFTLPQPQSVVLLSPTGSPETWNNTFSWTGIPAATYYYVQVIGPNQTVVYGEWYPIAQACTGLDCHISPDSTRDLGAGDYSWRILDYGDYGLGLWTDNLPFTLPQPQSVVLLSPTGSPETWNNTFSWTGIPAATYYYVQVIGPNQTVVYGEWYSIAQACTGLDCHISPDSTRDLGAGDYSWRILDYGDYGLGLWTAPMEFILP